MTNPIDIDSLKAMLENKESLYLYDVRRKADFDADPCLIPGATRLDPESISTVVETLKKDKPAVVYCVKGGSVSTSVADYLNSKNISTTFLKGGLKAWKESGGILVKAG